MATLQGLPEDVKRLICAELEKRQSVRSLWQVSRAWRAVAESFVYRGLALAVRLREGLGDDAKRLLEDDIASKYLEHARYSVIYSILEIFPPFSLAPSTCARIVRLSSLPVSTCVFLMLGTSQA